VRGGLGHPDVGASDDAEGGRADVRRTPRYSNRTLFRRLFAQTRGERKPMLALFGVELLATPAVLLSPVPLAIAVDVVIGSGHLPGFLESILPGFITSSDLGILAFAAFLQVFVVLLTQLQESGWYVLNTVVGERLTISFRARLFDHVQRLSLRFHDRRDTHDSIYRIQYDAEALQHVTEAAFPFVSSTLTLVAALYVTAQIDWLLALVAFAVTPILFPCTTSPVAGELTLMLRTRLPSPAFGPPIIVCCEPVLLSLPCDRTARFWVPVGSRPMMLFWRE